jgi:hypothetical protein
MDDGLTCRRHLRAGTCVGASATSVVGSNAVPGAWLDVGRVSARAIFLENKDKRTDIRAEIP